MNLLLMPGYQDPILSQRGSTGLRLHYWSFKLSTILNCRRLLLLHITVSLAPRALTSQNPLQTFWRQSMFSQTLCARLIQFVTSIRNAGRRSLEMPASRTRMQKHYINLCWRHSRQSSNMYLVLLLITILVRRILLMGLRLALVVNRVASRTIQSEIQ